MCTTQVSSSKCTGCHEGWTPESWARDAATYDAAIDAAWTEVKAATAACKRMGVMTPDGARKHAAQGPAARRASVAALARLAAARDRYDELVETEDPPTPCTCPPPVDPIEEAIRAHYYNALYGEDAA